MAKFGTKNALFGYFWARIFKILSYLKLAPSNLSNWKFREIMKIPKFGNENA